MTLEYKLYKKDYLNLYMSQVKTNKWLKVIYLILSGLFIFIGIINALFKHDLTEIFPLVPIGLFLGLYLTFIKPLLLKRHYTKYIDKNLKSSFGKNSTILIGDGYYLKTTSSLGEGKYNLDVLQEIIEYSNYTFIKIESGAFFILPKEKLNEFELNAFIDKIKEKVDVPHNIDLKRTLQY